MLLLADVDLPTCTWEWDLSSHQQICTNVVIWYHRGIQHVTISNDQSMGFGHGYSWVNCNTMPWQYMGLVVRRVCYGMSEMTTWKRKKTYIKNACEEVLIMALTLQWKYNACMGLVPLVCEQTVHVHSNCIMKFKMLCTACSCSLQ